MTVEPGSETAQSERNLARPFFEVRYVNIANDMYDQNEQDAMVEHMYIANRRYEK